MNRVLALCLAGLFSSGALAADLMQVYRDALANDAKFSAARAQFEAGQEKVVQGRAGLLPQIGLSADASWNDNENEVRTGRTSGDYDRRGYGVQLTQPLFRWQNWVQSRQGELQTALAGAQFDAQRQDLVLRVAEAYFDVLNAQDAVAAVSQLRTAAGEQLELAKTSFEVGTVTITDVHEAQSRFDLASAQEIAAQNQLEVARQVLAQIIGRQPDALAGLREGVALQRPQPDSIVDWVDAAELGNLGVQAQQLVREIAAREVEYARAGHLPTVDLVASHGVNRNPQLSVDRSEATSIGVQLNLPLYAGGRVSSVTREAAALRMKADADLEDARRTAVLAARQSWLGVTSGMAEVRALEAAQVSSTSALEANKLGYEVGVRINIDVLNAQTQLADTLQRLARARYDTLLAQLRLKAAAGTLGEDDVSAINALLAP
ncbi:TolC family outer membrane protein [Thauera linaloolentis]|uniref:TolC family type I secretion outer membrane protein n=1 Tax=Thauera linaloolentis (strain DSM 12138 / JCM 21573 / CCUG 41526 / CIP 105981 / IAM 15112 / NBRC 102519 / 47Lol) TaxID=1123367 RepID=N6Z5C5_THAL4|nr:TolC family outer membrane protein [Thauera linaloolentis]ENO89767.1 TolC family type I secretion outer membrane protein [Thauera linaloolentis 47Lol = DSM 12138]MCM8566065.1 TolC family outer membrane protein [Thauera linaloolentis]